MNDRVRWAAEKLKYAFSDFALLERACTHRSAAATNYERLEFLGDAFLSYVIGARLYELHPAYSEGDLSRARASLVNKRTLAEIALEIELGPQIVLGSGERRTGGSQRRSVLADVVESIIGAILLDSDHNQARDVILRLYDEKIHSLAAPEQLKDAKTRLQEWLQSRGQPLPHYNLVQVTGRDHEKEFLIDCELEDGTEKTSGTGRSRRSAEQRAAEAMLVGILSAR